MKPDSGDTTNALMLQIINIMVNGPDAVNISNLSSSTPYSSSTVWMQTLSYGSLAFSLLAAFGAVLGKQWLNSYKAARVRGSLEERGEERQKKFNGMEYWRLRTVLKSFLILLQISLLLFGLSLSANMWIQQKTISIIVMCTTAFGILFYATTILVSVFCPDSPFQTAETALIVVICKKFFTLLRSLVDTSSTYFPTYPRFLTLFVVLFNALLDALLDATFITRSTADRPVKLSAIRWLLETSTNPDVVEPAAAIVAAVRWPVEVNASPICARLHDTLWTYRDRQELSVKCAKAMARLLVEPANHTGYWRMPRDTRSIRSRCLQDAFTTGHRAWDNLKMKKVIDRQKHMADVRTALRTMVVHGMQSRFVRPDSSQVIRRGDLQWRHHDGRPPSREEFDWLIDYLVDKLDNPADDETRGDALLALSGMNGLGSDAKRASYINALIRCMAPTSPPRVQCAAVKCISDARKELLSIDLNGESMPHDVDTRLFNQLFNALSTVVNLRHEHDDLMTSLNDCYSRLIFFLTKNKGWRRRLTQNGHVHQCIRLYPTFSYADAYIAGICLHIDPSGNDVALSSIHEKLGKLMREAWFDLGNMIVCDVDIDDYVEILPVLVATTKQRLPRSDDGVASSELECLARMVDWVSQDLQALEGLDSNILSAVQSFSDDLERMVKRPNTQWMNW